MNKNRSVVNSNSAHLINSSSEPFLFIANKGEDLIAAFINCAKKAQFASASFSGFGAIKEVELGYFDEEKMCYKNRIFSHAHELVSMHGTITKYQGEYFVHAHASISDHECKVYAGHLHRAQVAVIVEATIIPFKNEIIRREDAEFKLKLIVAD